MGGGGEESREAITYRSSPDIERHPSIDRLTASDALPCPAHSALDRLDLLRAAGCQKVFSSVPIAD